MLTPGGRLVVLTTAWITGQSLPERVMRWVFTVTGESPPEEISLVKMVEPYSAGRFSGQHSFCRAKRQPFDVHCGETRITFIQIAFLL